jgi:hypothetical protein
MSPTAGETGNLVCIRLVEQHGKAGLWDMGRTVKLHISLIRLFGYPSWQTLEILFGKSIRFDYHHGCVLRALICVEVN